MPSTATKTAFRITVDGVDVSSNFEPLLISLQVKLDDVATMDEATIELDDMDAQIGLPRTGAVMSIAIGAASGGLTPEDPGAIEVVQVFDGFVDDVRWRLSRSTGRVLTIHAKSGDMSGKLKERMCAYKDNAKLSDVLRDWGLQAGLTDVASGGLLAAITRPYWGINESFMSWAQQRAAEIGATFKVIGTRGVMVARNGGESASGAILEPITAEVGVNLIDIQAEPVLSRPEYGQFATRWYDKVAAEWKEGTAPGGGRGPKHFHQYKAPDGDQAQKQSESNSDEIARERGGCESVTIHGNPIAQPVAACTVVGARPGVDGIYTISEVIHTLSRSTGFLTRLTLKDPSGGAGVDDRTAGVGDPSDTPVTTPQPTTATGIGGLPPTDTPAQPGGIGSA